jgi:hypothetical protein
MAAAPLALQFHVNYWSEISSDAAIVTAGRIVVQYIAAPEPRFIVASPGVDQMAAFIEEFGDVFAGTLMIYRHYVNA